MSERKRAVYLREDQWTLAANCLAAVSAQARDHARHDLATCSSGPVRMAVQWCAEQLDEIAAAFRQEAEKPERRDG